jgi:hypothetical protein
MERKQIQLPKTGSFSYVKRAGDLPFQPQQVPAGAMPVGGENSLPIPLGAPVAVDADSLTEREKKDLESVGWQPGDPIPNNLAELLAELSNSATDVENLPPPADMKTPALEVPKEVDIASLPQDKLQQVKQALEDAKNWDQQRKEQERLTPAESDPSVAEALRFSQQEGGTQVEIKNDLPQQTPKPTADKIKTQKPYDQNQKTEPQPETPQTSAETKACPNCGWDVHNDGVEEVSETDKGAFLAALLGGKPFTKIFELFGGGVQITVRELMPQEVDAIYMRASVELEDEGPMSDPIERRIVFNEIVNRYRLILQIVDIRTSESIKTLPQSLEEWTPEAQSDKERSSMLPEIAKQVHKEVIPTESLVRVVANCVVRFNKIANRLEVNASNENFYKAAGSSN